MASVYLMRRLLREIRQTKSARNWFSRESTKTATDFARYFCDEKMSSAAETVLRFKRLTPNARRPYKASECAAGYDLSSAYDYTIPPKEKALCKTDLQLLLPEGCYGRIAPRSGLTQDHFIDVGAGVIDYDYRGNVSVILFNFGNKEFNVKKGDRIAQIICERIFYPQIEEVENIDDTERGSSGFGSSGTT